MLAGGSTTPKWKKTLANRQQGGWKALNRWVAHPLASLAKGAGVDFLACPVSNLSVGNCALISRLLQ